jgi:DNA uptake protein ComE-like DNA-binding protein
MTSPNLHTTPSMPPKIPKLPVHEWCIVILFCCILCTLAAYAFFGKQKPASALSRYNHSRNTSTENTNLLTTDLTDPQEQQKIYVTIQGQVAKPGIYEMPPQSTIKDLLALAEPLPQSDTSSYNPRKKLKDGQKIHIYEKQWIEIELTGAVENPGSHRVLSGTRVCDLADQFQLLSEADRSALKKKKRLLQNGDSIKIMKKKKAKSNSSKQLQVMP